MATEPVKKPMVGWYDPRQLLRTGMQVLVSDLIGTRFDIRREEALTAKPDEQLIAYDAAGDFWFDYMADTGDGWDSTRTMLGLTAHDWHTADARAGVTLEAVPVAGGTYLPRGSFLLLGGDEIYPSASKQEYQERLLGPLHDVAQEAGEAVCDLYAIPGNHDWYDGLISFLRQFTQGRRIGDRQTPDGRTVGGWQTRQTRSYFALKLPQRWWLWAVDTQLEADLDQPQVDYFRAVIELMQRGDRLIVCIPEPDWLYGKMERDPSLTNNMAFLLDHVIGDKVKVYLTLSGDLHHYQRHEHKTDPMQQKIVAGGGGAFMHPTHFNNLDTVKVYGETFVRKRQFPEAGTSFWLTFLNLIFPVLNPWFGLLTAPIYLLFGWHMLHVEWSFDFLRHVLVSQPPLALSFVLLFYAGLYYFSVGRRAFRLLFGSLVHGSAHALAVWWLADTLNHWFGTSLDDWWHTTLPRLGSFLVGGYLLGALIMGLYLLVSLNVFRTHHNEAFSALRIKDYKNFLRLRISPDGTLEVYPIGVPRLHQSPILIEGPLTIAPDNA